MRESTTRYVLLGVLQQIGPASGYEAKRFIAESIGHFWQESYGQIYPELAALAREGLIAEVAERKASAGKRARTRYRTTAAGRAALREWLGRPATPQPVRNEMLLKVFFGAMAGEASVQGHLERARRAHGERVDFFREVVESLRREAGDEADVTFSLMVVRCGALVEAARLQWARESELLLAAHARGIKSVLATWKKLPPLPGGSE